MSGDVTAEAEAAPSPADRLTTQEKLLLSQAVYKLGAVAWPVVSKLLLEHPCCAGRGRELFSAEACEAYYIGLMTSIGMNVPAPDAMKPQATVHLRLAQTFYLARMTELKSTISTYESRFTSLMSEIQAIKSGSLDASIQAELRAVLARKYGKRLLDSWVPPSDEVKAAVEAGPIEEDVEVAEEKVEEMKVEAAPSPPASELSPPPSVPNENVEQPTTVITSPTPAVMEEPTTHASKRKASQQPRGVPASKRSGRRGASPALTQPESEVASETGAPEVEAVQPEPQVEPEAEAEPDQEVEDEPASTRGRGRRVSKRGVKKAQESPAPSTRTKESSPAVSRRAPSVSSTTSATPAASTRRGKRGMRDDVVSKSVREQSAAASVKEEVEDEPDEGPSRPPSRRSFAEENKEVKRGKRGSIRTPVEPDGDDDAKSQSHTPAAPSLTRHGRSSASTEQKNAQKLIYSLLDTISSHRNGNVFQTPVKKSDAPDYYDVIKRPMDLKTIRARIRDGNITSIDEFERDVLLMFANAMMFNSEGSQVYDMAQEMLRESENHIARFRSMQHDMGR